MGNQENIFVKLHWFVMTVQLSLPLNQGHIHSLVTFSPSWLEMAPRESQSPFHFLNTSVNKQIVIFKIDPPVRDSASASIS